MTKKHVTDNSSWAQKLVLFEGGAAEMAEALAEAMAKFDWSLSDPEPSPRLIRHYVQEGAIDRPERRGKEAIYGFRQLVQYVAVRWLLSDGWPLAKAAMDTTSRSTEELIALPPMNQAEREGADAGDPASTAAAALVASFQADARAPAVGAAEAVHARQIDLSARAGRYARARSEARAAIETPMPREALRIDLADWCAVVVDGAALEVMEDAQARALGAALSEALIDAKLLRGRKKKR